MRNKQTNKNSVGEVLSPLIKISSPKLQSALLTEVEIRKRVMSAPNCVYIYMFYHFTT